MENPKFPIQDNKVYLLIGIWKLISAQVNKGVRQGYGLLPVLFIVYINTILQEFKMMKNMGIQLTNRKVINTVLYANDQILKARSEDELQTTAYHSYLIARK